LIKGANAIDPEGNVDRHFGSMSAQCCDLCLPPRKAVTSSRPWAWKSCAFGQRIGIYTGAQDVRLHHRADFGMYALVKAQQLPKSRR
jgi:hypothetical protein